MLTSLCCLKIFSSFPNTSRQTMQQKGPFSWYNCALLFFDLTSFLVFKTIFVCIALKPFPLSSYYPFMPSVFIFYNCFSFSTSLLKLLSQRSLMSFFIQNATYTSISLSSSKSLYCFALETPFFCLSHLVIREGYG